MCSVLVANMDSDVPLLASVIRLQVVVQLMAPAHVLQECRENTATSLVMASMVMDALLGALHVKARMSLCH
jgi:hypothetical protein